MFSIPPIIQINPMVKLDKNPITRIIAPTNNSIATLNNRIKSKICGIQEITKLLLTFKTIAPKLLSKPEDFHL